MSGAANAGVQILPVGYGNPCRRRLMHMIRKGQLRATSKLCPAQQFNSLAA